MIIVSQDRKSAKKLGNGVICAEPCGRRFRITIGGYTFGVYDTEERAMEIINGIAHCSDSRTVINRTSHLKYQSVYQMPKE